MYATITPENKNAFQRMCTTCSLTDHILWYQARGACHTCPLACMPPAMHAPWPHMPPGHVCPSSHACPPATHAPQPHVTLAIYAPWACMPPGMHALRPHTPPGLACPPWTEFLTHASENITLSQTSFAGGNN